MKVNRRPSLGFACALLFASSAQASDSRLILRPYNPDEIVRIDGRLGVQATITFGERELIENVAVGDAEKWQITPNKRADVLFVKPLAANARTNMTVLTDKRTYLFDLVASPQARPLYILRFAYRDEQPASEAARRTPQQLDAAESAVLSGDPIAAPVDPARLDFAWRKEGAARLMPARIYDDGVATYLQLAERQVVPAILTRNEQGQEGPVNFAVRADTIVVEGVPRQIVLRLGKQSAVLSKSSTQPARSQPSQPAEVALSTAPAARTQ